MNIRKTLSDQLREAKTLSGMTYSDLMKVTKLSKATLILALNGGKGTGLDTFQKLFDACDYKINIDGIVKVDNED